MDTHHGYPHMRGCYSAATGRGRRLRRVALARWASHFVAVALLFLLPPFRYWALLTPNAADARSIIPGDFTEVHFPLHAFSVNAWQHHTLPLWAPGVNAGQPAFADLQFDAFYPPTIITGLLLGPHGAFTPRLLVLLEIGHLIFGALGMYLLVLWLLRRRRAKADADPAGADNSLLRPVAALTAAIVFTFSGYLTTYPMQDVDILQVSVWLPWAILALDVALSRRSTALALLAGLPLGMAVLAGHPQALLYVLYAALLFIVVRAASACAWRPSLAALARGLLALTSGLAFGAVQLLPSLELAPLSVRGQASYAFLSGGFAPHELVGAVLREGFGGAAAAYLGVVPLTLAAVGLLRGGRGVRRFALPLGAIAVVLSLGGGAALYPLAYLVGPGFNQVRDQERAIFLVSFAVALLAANGVWSAGDVLARAKLALPALLASAGAMLLVGGAVSLLLAAQALPTLADAARQALLTDVDGLDWALLLLALATVALGGLRLDAQARRAAPWALAALCALDLLSAHPDYGTQPGRADPYPVWPIIRTVQADAAVPFRVSSEGLLPADGNEGILYGLEDVVGSTPLELSAFAAINAAEDARQITELQRFALLNVRYVFTKRTFPAGAPLTLLGSRGDVHLYRLADQFAFPRAWLVHQAAVVDPAVVWSAVGKADLRTTAVLTTPLMAPLASGAGDHVQITDAAATRLDVAVHAPAAALLVVSEIAYPGWRATVDGNPVALVPADSALMAVPIAAGDHRVTLQFAPRSLRLGLIVTGDAIVAMALALDVAVLARKRRPAEQAPDPPAKGERAGD